MLASIEATCVGQQHACSVCKLATQLPETSHRYIERHGALHMICIPPNWCGCLESSSNILKPPVPMIATWQLIMGLRMRYLAVRSRLNFGQSRRAYRYLVTTERASLAGFLQRIGTKHYIMLMASAQISKRCCLRTDSLPIACTTGTSHHVSNFACLWMRPRQGKMQASSTPNGTKAGRIPKNCLCTSRR